MDGPRLPSLSAAQDQLGESLVRQLLQNSGITRAFSGGSPMHEGMFLEALSAAVAQQTPLMPRTDEKVTPEKLAHSLVEHGTVSSGFGPRIHPLTQQLSHHDGLDVAAPPGTPVHVVAGGVVALAGPREGYGNVVVVRHASGGESRYAHLEDMFVTPGQILQPGQTVGSVGSSGASTGPHVHFEWRHNGVVVDPTLALNKAAPVPNHQMPASASAGTRRAP